MLVCGWVIGACIAMSGLITALPSENVGPGLDVSPVHNSTGLGVSSGFTGLKEFLACMKAAQTSAGLPNLYGFEPPHDIKKVHTWVEPHGGPLPDRTGPSYICTAIPDR